MQRQWFAALIVLITLLGPGNATFASGASDAVDAFKAGADFVDFVKSLRVMMGVRGGVINSYHILDAPVSDDVADPDVTADAIRFKPRTFKGGKIDVGMYPLLFIHGPFWGAFGFEGSYRRLHAEADDAFSQPTTAIRNTTGVGMHFTSLRIFKFYMGWHTGSEHFTTESSDADAHYVSDNLRTGSGIGWDVGGTSMSFMTETEYGILTRGKIDPDGRKLRGTGTFSTGFSLSLYQVVL